MKVGIGVNLIVMFAYATLKKRDVLDICFAKNVMFNTTTASHLVFFKEYFFV